MDHIVGQDRALDFLQIGLRSGRVHHAYVFHGPEGVGKFTAAVAFGRVLLCPHRQADFGGRVAACGACASCLMIPAILDTSPAPVEDAAALAPAEEEPAAPAKRARRGKAAGPRERSFARPEAAEDEAALGIAHPDLRVVTKELARYSEDAQVRQRKLLSIPVDVLREHLLGPVYRASQLGGAKVFIVDEAHLLEPTGQNLLLKTLEEPPANTYIVLITSNEDKLLPTIRSRCHRVAFTPLPDAQVAGWLRGRAGGAGAAGQGPAELEWAVKFAEGSLGRAEQALRFGLASWGRVVEPALDEMASGRFPFALGAQIAALVDEYAERWVKSYANASKDAANKKAAGLMWTLISQIATRRLSAMAPSLAGLHPQDAEDRVAPWLGVIEAVAKVEAELASNVQMKLATDHLARLAYGSLAAR